MKGTTPTKADKALWSRMAAYGCVACRKDGWRNLEVSIHHIDGRTKPGAHQKVLPLCYQHHQSGNPDAPSVHPWKTRFEEKYGKQTDLLDELMRLLDDSHT